VAVPFRAKQLIVSIVGALLFVPVDLFLGGQFAFNFGARSSPWAWAFDLTAFWGQLLGILISFFKPRLGGIWILASLAASVAIRLSVQLAAVHGPARWSEAAWLHTAPGLLKTGGLFWTTLLWAGPLVLALLLLHPMPAKERGRAETDC
jgi:hypothetical protein